MSELRHINSFADYVQADVVNLSHVVPGEPLAEKDSIYDLDFPVGKIHRYNPAEKRVKEQEVCPFINEDSHADLTDEYAAVPGEIREVANWFGKEVLTQIDETDFYANLPALRNACGDRAVMRCIHFYQENTRVVKQVEALENGDFDTFLKLITESGHSSWMYLQNVIPAGYKANQDVAIALALCEHYLKGKGAYRVHGGGFAGTVQAFVPYEILDSFVAGIDGALGKGACHVLSIRPQGGVEMRDAE